MKKNYIYNLIFKVFSIVFNILSVPYLSRVLGAENIGEYSYASSIVNFFMLFCLLGVNNYGNRLIAGVRDDKLEKSRQFFSLYIMQAICSIITCLLYVLYVVFFSGVNQLLLLIQIVYLLSSLFDISWFFYGNEKFKGTIIIGIIEKIVCILFIILFVNEESDILHYAWIISFCTLFKNLSLLPLLKQEIVKVKVSCKDIFSHLKPCLILFLPILSVNIYKVVNKIILGSISGNIELGYFEQADKIINIPLCIITSLAVVVFPKMSNLISKGNDELVKKHMEHSMSFVMFLVLPISFGLIAIANDFVVLLLGNEFLKTAMLTKGLAISIIFIAWASVIQNHYLICKKMDKEYALSVCFGAVVSIILNIVLIPSLKSLGAMITTIVTEFVVTFLQTIVLRKQLPIKKYFQNIIPYFFKSAIMMIIIFQVNVLDINNIFLKLIIQVVIGLIVYFLLNIQTLKTLLKKQNDY